MCKKILVLLCCLCLFLPAAQADSLPYGGTVTSPYGTTAPSPVGYDVAEVLDGNQMGAGRLSKPSDLYVYEPAGEVYIADTGNQRIVVLDRDLRFLREYTGAGELVFQSPKGVFVNDHGIYVADDGLSLVIQMDQQGNLIRRYERPVSSLYEDSTPYQPQKVVADSAGRVYVLSLGVYQGLIRFTETGEFMDFYGANRVTVTAKVALQKILRVFMTREQRAAMEAFIPIEYSNVDIDSDDMVYASVNVQEKTNATPPPSLFKLNPLGAPYRKFPAGALADALNNEAGWYTCLDSQLKNVVEFSESTGVVLSFGGSGNQQGLFQEPVALGRLGESVLVLDRTNGNVTRFELTPYGRLVHTALTYSESGRYQEAIPLYEELLRRNSNNDMAYTGLGKAYYELEDYEQSMYYYRLAQDRQGYSDAFKEQSTLLIRQNMGWIFLGLGVVLVAVWGHKLWRKHHGTPVKDPGRVLKPWRHPFYCMVHAYTGFEDMKLQGTGSMGASVVLLAALALSTIITHVLTGFAFNPYYIERLNAPLLIAGTLGAFLVFYLASWAVSSLMSDCEGKPRELLMVEAYALLPYILGTVAIAAITNFVTLDVKPFLNIFQVLCIAWSVILMVVGMMQIHQLSLKKTLLYLLLVIIAMVIVLVLLVLLYSLVQQFVVFLKTLYSEMMYRI